MGDARGTFDDDLKADPLLRPFAASIALTSASTA